MDLTILSTCVKCIYPISWYSFLIPPPPPPNTAIPGVLWDDIDLPPPNLPQSSDSSLEKEVTGNETFQLDSFLEENNQFLLEIDKMIKHYDKQVARGREIFIKELEEKYKNRKINKTVKPSAYSSFEREIRNLDKLESENIENRNEILNRQSVQFDEGKKRRELWQKQSENFENRRRSNQRNFDTDDSEPAEINGNLNKNHNSHTMPITHFPSGMTQTSFHIISNW